MNTFWASLALVAVAQIPLLIKLWLDHRAAASGFKQELFRRQLDTYKELSSLLSSVQRNCEAVVTLVGEETLPAKKDTDFFKELMSAYFKDNSNLIGAVNDADFLLPARLSVDFPGYCTCSTRLLFKAFGFSESPETRKLTIPEIWSEQQGLYNSLVNQMRLACGIDAVADSTFRMLNAQQAKISLVVRQYKP